MNPQSDVASWTGVLIIVLIGFWIFLRIVNWLWYFRRRGVERETDKLITISDSFRGQK